MEPQSVVTETNIAGLPLLARGKVRDIYDLGDSLLIVATDRISAFDVVLPNGIPHKGAILTQLSAFWFEQTSDIIGNHIIATAPDAFPPELRPIAKEMGGRAMLVHKARRIEVECIVRGYISGSAWAEYVQHGTVCGERMPGGLRESDRLPEPIFTPSTKAETGHDQNISTEQLAEMVGKSLATQLEEKSLAVYRRAEKVARERGIIIADTKMEFGFLGDELILIDELLTPDSSRFWAVNDYQPGRSQPSFDKQYVRDWLIEVGWNKEPPAPALPPEVVRRTSEKYLEAYQRLTGKKLAY